MPSPRRLLSTNKVYEGRIWDVVSDSFQLSEDTDTLVRDYIDHPGAVAVLPMNVDGEILLLKQYRHPVGMDLWEIPAGLLDIEGEDFVVGAARELAEEADLNAATWNVLADFFNSPGSSSEAIRIYLARGLSDVPEADRHTRTDEEAEIELHWVPLEDAVRAVLEGRLHNPSAVVGILAAAAAKADGFTSLRPANAPWPAHPSQR
ncbi:ADP-ribose pyrophosphatase [Paenarthrobacter sp. A20]|nr:ADP-ribose pyrophosphatase [Paenarthrobacter sp. A20]